MTATAEAAEPTAAEPASLTAADIAWLEEFDAFAQLELVGGDAELLEGDEPAVTEEVVTAEELQAQAEWLRGCHARLAELGAPGPAVQHLYFLAAEACGDIAWAGKCAEAWASVPDVLAEGDPRLEQSMAAARCLTTRTLDGTERLVDAQLESFELLVRAGAV